MGYQVFRVVSNVWMKKGVDEDFSFLHYMKCAAPLHGIDNTLECFSLRGST